MSNAGDLGMGMGCVWGYGGKYPNNLPAVLSKLLFKSNLSMSTITWLEK